MAGGPRILIVEARFLRRHFRSVDQRRRGRAGGAGGGYKRVIVPGMLEIPAAIRFAVRAMEVRAIDSGSPATWALGCSIKGETDHYEHVCRESMRGLQDWR